MGKVMCPYYPEVQIDLICEKGVDLRNVTLGTIDCTEEGMKKCPAMDWTCTDCGEKDICQFAFDLYCTDGECLAMK
jgi:hypothetical protein